MRTKTFLQSIIKTAIYQKKADTKNSYYRISGDTILPGRLDISLENTFTKAENKGRMLTENVVGEIRGQFKKTEKSALKQNTPFKVSSKIFRMADFPQLAGYGDLAISDEEGKCTKVQGLAVFVKAEEDSLIIFFATGKPSPKFILEMCGEVAERLNGLK